MADWVDRLLSAHAVPTSRTIAQYAAGLRYWATWHQLRYGMPLPLADAPPTGVNSEVVAAFVDDHYAIAVEGRLQMRMVPAIFHGLREAGFNARIECVAPATTTWRLQVLHKAHGLLSLRFDWKLVRSRIPEIYAAWEAERAALGIPMVLPMSATNTVKALIGACGKDRDGIMDVALILLLCQLTSSQVAKLHFSELKPGTILRDGEELDVVISAIHEPVGEMQTSQLQARFIGDEAILIKAWGAIREDEVQGNEDWFFVRKSKHHTSAALDPAWISKRIHLLAQRAGLADATGRNQVSSRWLRKSHEREWREHSTLVKVAHTTGVSTRSVLRMTRAARST